MTAIAAITRQAFDALLLREHAYRSMRDDPNPIRRGLVFIVTIGVIAALAGVVGAVLFEWTMPDFEAIYDAVLNGMQQMAWMDEVPEEDRDEVLEGMERGFDISRQILGWVLPSVTSALANVIGKPVSMVVVWLLYGVLAYAAARALGGTGDLGGTYGATALAAAPQLLGVAHVLPYVTTAGLGTWALICNYIALKNAHDLSPGRAFWATLIPLLVLGLIGIVLAVLGMIIFISLFASQMAGGIT